MTSFRASDSVLGSSRLRPIGGKRYPVDPDRLRPPYRFIAGLATVSEIVYARLPQVRTPKLSRRPGLTLEQMHRASSLLPFDV